MLTGEFTYDSIDAETQAINQATFGGSVGLGNNLGGHDESAVLNQSIQGGRRGGSGNVASNDFFKLYGSYTRLQIPTLPSPC